MVEKCLNMYEESLARTINGFAYLISPPPSLSLLDKCGLSLQIPRSDIRVCTNLWIILCICKLLSLSLSLSVYIRYFFYGCLHYFFITPWLQYTYVHAWKRKKFIPLHPLLPWLSTTPCRSRNGIAHLKFVPLHLEERKKISKGGKKKGEGRFRRIIVRSYPRKMNKRRHSVDQRRVFNAVAGSGA